MINRKLLLIGGATLVAGGLAYWYLSQKPPPPPPSCRTYDGDPQGCASQSGCYYWDDGTCRNYPQGIVPCDPQYIAYTCHPGFNGMKRCDIYKNQCICDGTNWNLLQLDSQICRDNVRHTQCWVNADNYATCLNTYESGTDLCKFMNEIGCPCGGSVLCGTHTGASWCDTNDFFRCIKAETHTVTINNTWEQCKSTADVYNWCDPIPPFWDYRGMTCDYDLGDLYAGVSLVGEISFEWTTPVSGIDTRIYAYNEISGWKHIGNHWGIGEGPHDLAINFAAQTIQKLRFASCSTFYVNSKPKTFFGTLMPPS